MASGAMITLLISEPLKLPLLYCNVEYRGINLTSTVHPEVLLSYLNISTVMVLASHFIHASLCISSMLLCRSYHTRVLPLQGQSCFRFLILSPFTLFFAHV